MLVILGVVLLGQPGRFQKVLLTGFIVLVLEGVQAHNGVMHPVQSVFIQALGLPDVRHSLLHLPQQVLHPASLG